MYNDDLTSACGSGGCSSCGSSCGPAASGATINTERPLGEITAILAGLGLEVTYAYDDLVFVQECAFLLQFTDDPATLKLFTNTECDPAQANEIASSIVLAFHGQGLLMNPAGRYTLTQNGDETVSLAFSQ